VENRDVTKPADVSSLGFTQQREVSAVVDLVVAKAVAGRVMPSAEKTVST
jgi:hypothetical protein